MTATVSSDRPVALITGATRGLGHAIAVELAKTHHVIVGGRSAEAVGRVVDELGDASAFVADLTNEDEAAQALSDVLATVGRLNVLVNNAGVGKKATLDDTTRDDWRWLLETNVIAVADVTRMCLPKLRESFGTVVVINSGAGVRVYPSDAAYTVSKWALRSFTDCLREAERGRVRVVAIHPGRIDTDMQVAMQAQAGKTYNPDDHMRASDVAKTVRLAVDMPVSTNVDELHIRTTEAKKTNPSI